MKRYTISKHTSVVLVALAGLVALYGRSAGEQTYLVAGSIGAIVLSVVRYFLGEAEKRAEKRAAAGAAGGVQHETGGFHGEIEAATRHIDDGNASVAIERLTMLANRHADRLGAREKFRLFSNRGNAWLSSGDKSRAADDFIRAGEQQPSDPEARAYTAMGHMLLGAGPEANSLARTLCDEQPNLARAHMVRIRTEAEHVGFEELKETLPASVLRDAEVALALHDRAVSEGSLSEGIALLRAVADTRKDWPDLKQALGSTLLQRVLETSRTSTVGLVVEDEESLQEAARLFTEVIDKVGKSTNQKMVFAAYLNRGTVLRLLGEDGRAEADLREALRLQPKDLRAVLALAAHARPDQLGESIRLLEASGSMDPEPLLLRAILLIRRGDPGALEESCGLLEAAALRILELEDPGKRIELVARLIEIYARMDRAEDSIGLLARLPDGALDGVVGLALESEALRLLDRLQESQDAADEASRLLGDSTDWVHVRLVAEAFQRLNRHRSAFGLWRRIIQPDILLPDTFMLLDSALKIGEDDFVIEFCRSLRANGHYTRACLAREVEVLTRYSEFQAARDLFAEYLVENPEDNLARLQFSLLALDCGWEDVVERRTSRLPTVESLEDPSTGIAVVRVLRSGPQPIKALDYAYDLYRAFPESPLAQRSLWSAVFAPAEVALEVPDPVEVGPGTAVRYSEEESGLVRWIVVEDCNEPSLTRGEFAPHHTTVKPMLGKKVGDNFVMREGIRGEVLGQVLEIRDKRIYRAQDVHEHWQERFPDLQFFESVPIRASEPASPDDFAEMVKVMERLDEGRQTLTRSYQEGRLPITSLALFNGASVLDTVGYVCGHPDLSVRCCDGSREELERGQQSLSAAKSIVLDPVTIAVLARVEETTILESLPFDVLVTEGALKELLDLSTPPSGISGYVGVSEGRLQMKEVTQLEQEERNAQLRELVEYLRARCDVIGGGDLAKVAPPVRRKILDCVSRSSAEAAAAAWARSIPLWTDDQLLISLVGTDLPVERVWTQAVFLWARAAGVIEERRANQLSSSLIRYGFSFVSLTAACVLNACEDALWNPAEERLKAVLNDFGNPGWSLEVAGTISAETLAKVWTDAPTVEDAQRVTTRLLAAVSGRKDAVVNRSEFPGDLFS